MNRTLKTAHQVTAVLRRYPLLVEAGRLAAQHGCGAYLVGGAVRDLLQGKKTLDWDIMIDGDTAAVVAGCSAAWQGTTRAHSRFGTFVVTLPDGSHIDFATARTETYPQQGKLPAVRFGRAVDDLKRRDFTLNALALSLIPKTFGRLLDPHNGRRDLRSGMLRVLHARSFRDDPTRMVRLARFAGRGYGVAPATLALLRRDAACLAVVSDERLREELLAILAESRPSRAVKLCVRWGILQYLVPGIGAIDARGIDRACSCAERLAALTAGMPEPAFTNVLSRLKLPRALLRELKALRQPPREKGLVAGADLIALGYRPGPLFARILRAVEGRSFASKQEALSFVVDTFPHN